MPRIISDEEAENCTVVICSPVGPSHFADNVETVCAECGTPIMHRPNAPKKPNKVCISCAMELIEADDDPDFVITKGTMQ